MKALFLALVLGLTGAPAWAGPVIATAQGRVEGTADADVAVFKAIPFAAPPVGQRRWRAPAHPLAWTGIRPATAFGPVCPQAPVDWAGHDLDNRSEDCLTLNVWTPRPTRRARLPVMVWLHGGGYTAGAGSQGTYVGTTLARHGAVVVTINYRLGALGYLAHPALSRESSLGVSGNYGLLDQIAALQWVHDNIAHFGGDPANVTIAGQSAGGGSAMLVTVSPLARGLFRRAIFESGAALGLPGTPGAMDLKQAEDAGATFARKLGALTAAQLRALPVTALTAADVPREITAPINDGRTVPVDITAAYRRGAAVDVPILLGWNSDEAARFIDHATPESHVASARLSYGDLAPALLRLYPAPSNGDATHAARELMSDAGFGWRSWSIAEARRSAYAAPTFLYQFDNPPPAFNGSRTRGAVHSDELGYVWGNNDLDRSWPPADRALAEQMQRYWIAFMRTGDPNGPGLPRWTPYTEASTALWLRVGQSSNQPPLRVAKLKAIDGLVQGAGFPGRPVSVGDR